MSSLPSHLDEVRRILVIGAHPDDPDFGCAGSIARWTAEGRRVDYVIATSGDKGRPEADSSAEAFMALREAEQRAAAECLGVGEVVFLRWPDGELRPDSALRGALVREIRRLRPDMVVTPDPYSRLYRQHSDHRVIGQMALEAVFPAARLGTYHPEHLAEGLELHIVKHMLFLWTDAADVQVDIAETLEEKIAAIRLHASQVSSTDDAFAERVRARAAEAASGTGLSHCELFKYADVG